MEKNKFDRNGFRIQIDDRGEPVFCFVPNGKCYLCGKEDWVEINLNVCEDCLYKKVLKIEEEPKPLDLEILEEVVELFKETLLKNYDTAKFTKEDIEFVIMLTKKVIKRRLINACKFYLKYKNKPELLMKEHPEYKEKVEKMRWIPNPDFEACARMTEEDKRYYGEYGKDFNCSNCPFPDCKLGEFIENENFEDEYNEWLFKLAFKNVLEGDENGGE